MESSKLVFPDEDASTGGRILAEASEEEQANSVALSP
jgi:hypothetical protein